MSDGVQIEIYWVAGEVSRVKGEFGGGSFFVVRGSRSRHDDALSARDKWRRWLIVAPRKSPEKTSVILFAVQKCRLTLPDD